jgi:hypothetical protein
MKRSCAKKAAKKPLLSPKRPLYSKNDTNNQHRPPLPTRQRLSKK